MLNDHTIAHETNKGNVPTEKAQLDQFVEDLTPLLKYINLHRFLWGFTLVCAFIAWNRGLMLLYALVAFLLAVLLVSHIYRFFNLRNIDIKRTLPHIVKARESFDISYQINTRGHKHFISLEERFISLEHLAFVSDTDLNVDIVSTDIQPNSSAVHNQLFITHVHKQASMSVLASAPKRGVYLSNAIAMSCAYPLGIIESEKIQALEPKKMYVLPPTFPIASLDFPLGNEARTGSMVSEQKGSMDDFTGLRQYRKGDPLKLVHWSASAKQISQNRPWLSKNFDSTDSPAFLIMLNQFSCRYDSFETMLILCASLAQYASQAGLPCIIMGIDVYQDKQSKDQKELNQPWHISMTPFEHFIDENLLKLASLTWLKNNATYQSTRKNAKKPLSQSFMIASYQDLIHAGIARFAHSNQANVMITFDQFEHQIPSNQLSHISCVFKETGIKNNLRQRTRQGDVYHIDPTSNLMDLALLFGQDFVDIRQNDSKQNDSKQKGLKQDTKPNTPEQDLEQPIEYQPVSIKQNS